MGYLAVSLALAKNRHNEGRTLLATGMDLMAERKIAKTAERVVTETRSLLIFSSRVIRDNAWLIRVSVGAVNVGWYSCSQNSCEVFQHHTLVESTEQPGVLLELIHMFPIQVCRYRTRRWTTQFLSSGR